MKSGWEKKQLGELCEVLDSKRKPITKRDRIAGDYPYYGATGILDYVHDYIFDEKLVLIGEDGAKWGTGDNTAFIVNGKCWVNNHAHVVKPKRETIQDEWIVHFLNFSDLSCYISGMTVPKLNQEKMRSITVPLPPLPEQRRIVAILDEAFADITAAKEKAEQNLKNAKAVFESHLRYIFNQKDKGWITTKIGKQITLQRGFDITKKQQNINGKVPVVSSGGVKSFHDKSMVNAPGVVIGRKGTIGSSFYIEEDFWPHDTTLWIKNFSGNNEKFVFYFFNFLDVKHLDSGTANPALNRNFIHNIDTNWNNNIKYQEKIVESLDSLKKETSRLESLYQQKLSDLEELKKSVLQQAFSGAL